MIANQQGILQGMQALQQGITRSSNASAIAGSHEILALDNPAGLNPVAAGVWFPQTKLDLTNATPAQENALIAFYGLALLPAQPNEGLGSQRKRTICRHLGVRM